MASSDKPTAVHFTLIFFVMLSLILMVVTYLSYRDLSIAQGDLATTEADLAAANSGIERHLAEVDALKQAIGTEVETVGSPGEQGTALGELSQVVASNGRDLQAPNAIDTIIAMRSTIDQQTTELAAKEAALQAEQDQMLALKAQYQEQLAQVQQSQSDSESTLQDNVSTHNEIVSQKDENITTLREDINRIRLANANLQDQMGRMREDYEVQVGELEENNTRLRSELDEFQRVSFEVPDGTIRRVDNTTRTVWINLGEADGLSEQVTFSVYDQAHHGVGRGPEDIKGRVEVVQMLGPHLSQARILEEDIYRPMTEGDVVYTPVWSAGLVEKFAFSGEIDFDGDGQSDRSQLHNMLTHAGAEISVEIDDQGNRHPEDGVINRETKFLVLGHIPDPSEFAAEDPERDRAIKLKEEEDQLIERAQHQGIRILSLNEFLAFMGYKPTQRLFLPGSDMPYTLQGDAQSSGASGTLDPTFSSGRTSELFRRKEDNAGNPLPPGTRQYGN